MKRSGNHLLSRVLAFIILEIFLFSSLAPAGLRAETNAFKKSNVQPVAVNDQKQADFGLPKKSPGPTKSSLPNQAAKPGYIREKARLVKSNRAFVDGLSAVIIQYKKVRLEIPAGAVAKKTEIIIEELEQVNELNPGMANVTETSCGYRFLPDGIKFKKNILLTLPYDRSRIASEQDLNSLATYFYDEEEEHWKKLKRVALDPQKATISSLTNHFTDMINSVLKLPEAPKPLSFNPNSIKDLKAANPFAEIPELKGLQANAQGTASFNLPIRLPPARVGMTPQLALTYNSNLVNGWLGQGFNLAVPAVTIDTRFGLPAYDGQNDTYLLNGAELVEEKRAGQAVYYRCRVEQSFSRIVRKGDQAANYYFEITEKDGTISRYGTADAVLQSYRPGNAIFTWYLKQITDPNGNRIIYHYSSDHISNTGKEPSRFTYLNKIEYNIHASDDQHKYSILFINEPRHDVQISCRGRFKTLQRYRLAKILIHYNNTLIRQYHLLYQYGPFGKSLLSQWKELDNQSPQPEQFYAYSFDYHALDYNKQSKTNIYAGFSPALYWENADHLTKNTSYNSGANFYTGIGLYDYQFTAGISVGCSSGSSLDEQSFLDIDGDNLPDLVKKDSYDEQLLYKKNTGQGFEAGWRNLTGLLGYLGSTKSTSFDFGLARGIGPQSSNFGKGNSHAEAKYLLRDVDGDGFIDLVLKDSDYFYRNNLKDSRFHDSGQADFVKQYWAANQDSLGGETEDLSELYAAYHRLDPIVKWRPYHSGVIRISNQIRKIDQSDLDENEKKKRDGVKLDLYCNDTPLWPDSVILQEGEALIDQNKKYINGLQVNKDSDRLYFKVNAIKNIYDDQVDWNPEIIYQKINLHDDMQDFYYALPGKIVEEDYNYHHLNELDNFFDCYQSSQSGDNNYSLKTNIKQKKGRALRSEFVSRNVFLPKFIPFDDFIQIILPKFGSDNSVAQSFFKYYKINLLKQCLELKNKTINANLSRYLKQAGYSVNQYKTYRYAGQGHVVHSDGKGKFIEITDSRAINEQQKILHENELTNMGDQAPHCILLGHTIDNGSKKTKILNIDRKSKSATLTVRDSQGGQITYSKGQAGFNYSFEKDELEVREQIVANSPLKIYRLEKADFIPSQIAADLYGDFLRHLLPEKIKKATYDRLVSLSSETVVNSLYRSINQLFFSHQLRESLNKAQINYLLGLFSKLADFPFFYFYDQNSDYFILEKQESSLTDQERSTIISQLESIDRYQWLEQTIKVYDSHLYDVDLISYNEVSGTIEEREVVCKKYEQAGQNKKLSFVNQEIFNQQGEIIAVREYLHVFSLASDFNLVNLNRTPPDLPLPEAAPGQSTTIDFSEINQKLKDNEPFSGGVYNWFFGEWNGEQTDWRVADFTVDQNDYSDLTNDQNEHQYSKNFMAMCSRKGSSQLVFSSKSQDGSMKSEVFHQHPLIRLDRWVGSEFIWKNKTPSRYQRQAVDEEECYFTSYVSYSTFCPSRKGGNMVDKIPGEGQGTPLSRIGNLRYSKEESMKVGFGLSAPGNVQSGSLSIASSSSHCKKDFFDINGDRYPDQILNSGSSIKVAALKVNAAKIGFEKIPAFENAYSRLRYSSTSVFGKGVTTGPSGTTMQVRIDSNGEPSGVEPGAPGFGMSISFSDGKSDTDIDLFDINGDGLPDHVKRDNYDNFRVKLNLGDTFSPYPEEWLTPGGDLYENTIRYSEMTSTGVALAAGVAGYGIHVDVNKSSENKTLVDVVDLNGDGLVDVIRKPEDKDYFYVSFNLGNTFSAPARWLTPSGWGMLPASGTEPDLRLSAEQLQELSSHGTTTLTLNRTDLTPEDIKTLKATFEQQIREEVLPNYPDAISCSEGNGKMGLGGEFCINIKIPIPLTPIVINISIKPGFTNSASQSKSSLLLSDINGDGCPDHIVKKESENFCRVKLNNTGKTGLLKSIKGPGGNRIELDYVRAGNTVQMPASRYVLSEVKKYDGLEKDDLGNEKWYNISFQYLGGRYDRQERMFYGFNTVIQTDPDGAEQLFSYHNTTFYNQGQLAVRELRDQEGKLWSKTENNYHIAPLPGYDLPFLQKARSVLLAETIDYKYDKKGSELKTSLFYEYDSYGNIIQFKDLGLDKQPEDDLVLTITYAYQTTGPIYRVDRALKMQVKNPDGFLLREKSAQYDPATGNLLQHHQTLIDAVNQLSQTITTTFDYDAYGNMSRAEDANGYFIQYSYHYDFSPHTYRVQTVDSGGYQSSLEVSYLSGSQIKSIDTNGSSFGYEYDSFGRLIKVWTSYDQYDAALPGHSNGQEQTSRHAVEYLYFHRELPARAVTKNKIYFDPLNLDCLNTVLFADGFRRVIQTKKESYVVPPGGFEPEYGMTVSGKIVYNKRGQVIKQGQPVFQAGGYNAAYHDTVSLVRPALSEYDSIGRVVKKVLPDGSAIRYDYAIENDLYKTITTDPNQKSKISYMDARQNIVRMEQFNKNSSGTWKTLVTRYEYNLLGEITRVYDAENNQTSMTYDSLGRRTSVDNPDSGLIIYKYDRVGNVIEKEDANLRLNSQKIKYDYDHCNRLKKVTYPFTAPVVYEYGNPGAAANCAGRLKRITDQSGVKELAYGKLGEQIKVVQKLNRLIEGDVRQFTTGYEYDYLGQIISITYPGTYYREKKIRLPGEVIHYQYNSCGQIERVYGIYPDLPAEKIDYIQKIYYDSFGQRVYIKYGNGVETRYTYDENRRWLSHLKTSRAGKSGKMQTYQNLSYDFDRAGNILSISNDTTNGNQRRLTQTFHYDDLYQLINAQGVYEHTGFETKNQYSQSFSYDAIGNMVRKTSRHATDLGTQMKSLNYDLIYQYEKNAPHRAVVIDDIIYQYDANGNVIKKKAKETDSSQDSNGNGSGEPEAPIDGDPNSSMEAYGFTWDDQNQGQDGMAEYEWDEDNRLKKAVTKRGEVQFLYDSQGERTIKQAVDKNETMYASKLYQRQLGLHKECITRHIFLGPTRIVTKVTYEDLANHHINEQKNTFYYHGDHLGSSNVITDYQGDEYQYLEYTPYGEAWIDEGEESGFGSIHFKFSGKELDEETGLYYFGARYLDPRNSRWISCDPVFEEYLPIAPINDDAKKHNKNLPGMGGVFNAVNINLFQYAANNPIKYIDPNGEYPAISEYFRFIFDHSGGAGRLFNIGIDSLNGDQNAQAISLFVLKEAAIESADLIITITDIGSNAGTTLVVSGFFSGQPQVVAAGGALSTISSSIGLGARGVKALMTGQDSDYVDFTVEASMTAVGIILDKNIAKMIKNCPLAKKIFNKSLRLFLTDKKCGRFKNTALEAGYTFYSTVITEGLGFVADKVIVDDVINELNEVIDKEIE